MGGDNRGWVWLSQYPFEDLAAAFTNALAHNLRVYREAAGLTRIELTEQLGRELSDTTLMNYEQATRHMGLERVLDLCITLNRSMPELFEETLMRAHHTLLHGPRPHRGRAPVDDDGLGEQVGDEEKSTEWYHQRANTHNAELRDLIARLRLENSDLHNQVEAQKKRADTAEDTAVQARATIAELDGKHRAEIEQIRADYERQLRDVRLEARRDLAAPERSPVALPEPTKKWEWWGEAADAMTIRDGAEEFLVRVYNMSTPLQQFILKAFAYGKSTGAISNARKVSTYQVDRDVLLLARRFRVTGEEGVRVVARKLFATENGDDEN